MNTRSTNIEPCVDFVGHHRQQRRRDLCEQVQHRVQCVNGILVTRPEAIAATTDVPISEHVEERTNGLTRSKQVV